MEIDKQFDYAFKFIIVGDVAVGKTSLIQQFSKKKFPDRHESTIGVEFGDKIVMLNGVPLKIQIWDTGGQESFLSITRSYFRAAAGVLLLYDISRAETFKHITKWLSEVKENGNKSMSLILIGNKSDLEDDREVTREEGEILAARHNMLFCEASAKTSKNVDFAFMETANLIYQKIQTGQIDTRDEIFGVKPSKQLQDPDMRRSKLQNPNDLEIPGCQCGGCQS